MGKRPDYILCAKEKREGAKGARIGVGWENRTNAGVLNIAVKLNPGVRIAWDDELWFTLWEEVEYEEPMAVIT